MPETLEDQLVRHEGLRLKPYVDTVGKVTIGCGRNLTDVGISHDEAILLLRADIANAADDLHRFGWFADLNEARQRALIDMRFNLGATGFRQFHLLILACGRGDVVTAATEMRRSQWYGQVGTRGEDLARMMESGELDA